MDRLTRLGNDGEFYVVDRGKINSDANGYVGEVIDKLGRFEDFYEDLVANQGKIPKELEQLRQEGKKKTYRYRELVGNKLAGSYILGLLRAYGLH